MTTTARERQLREELSKIKKSKQAAKLRQQGEEAFVTIPELAALTGIPRASLYRMVSRPDFPIEHLPDTSMRVKVGEFNAWRAKHRRTK